MLVDSSDQLEVAAGHFLFLVMARYNPPEWGAKHGMDDYGIDVIKGGVVIDNLDISKSGSLVFGRMEPVCDVVLQHPSISRQHAVLQFDKHGRLFVRDFESTYGTWLNKQKINCSRNTR